MAAGPLALLVAFALSPVAVETGSHLLSHPWKLPVIVVPFLLFQLVREEREREGADAPSLSNGSRIGFGSIGAAIFLELLTLFAGLPRLGRPALALAVFGWLRAARMASTWTAALAIFLVPLPSAVSQATSPALEDLWKSLAASVLPGVSAEVFPLELHFGDGGHPVAWLGAGLGFWASRRRRLSCPKTAFVVILGASLGFAGQGAGIVAAGMAADRLGSGAARGLLAILPSLLVVGAALLSFRLTSRAARRGLP